MEKTITTISSLISSIFSPLLIPTFGLAIAMHCSELHVMDFRNKLTALAIVFALTGLLPFILIRWLEIMKLVKNLDLTERTERTLPYSATLCLYIATATYLHIANAPWWLTAFMIGGTLALAVAILVNRHWKISAHATSSGALTALVAGLTLRLPQPSVMLPMLIAACIVAGLTCTARLILDHHTPAQVYAGFANGFICVCTLSVI